MITKGTELNLYLDLLRSAKRSAYIFSLLSKLEKSSERSFKLKTLAEHELKFAHKLSKLLVHRNNKSGHFGRWTVSTLVWLTVKLLGSTLVLNTILKNHQRILPQITKLSNPSTVSSDIFSKSSLLNGLLDTHDLTDGHESRGRGFFAGKGGSLRAAVLGMNDGLISNFSLVTGVAAGTNNPEIVLIAGIAGLLAGSFSMAAGEYISMRSQRDIYENIVQLERAELTLWPEAEKRELAAVYEQRGFTQAEANLISHRISDDLDIAVNTHVKEEFGLDSNDLGSPKQAAISSLIAFSVGALVPILPYIFSQNQISLTMSFIFTALSLMVVGAGLAYLSGVNLLLGGIRMLLIGSLAATVTFGIGTLVGRFIS